MHNGGAATWVRVSHIEEDKGNKAVHMCHVHEKCCTAKKEMKFVTILLYNSLESSKNSRDHSGHHRTDKNSSGLSSAEGIQCEISQGIPIKYLKTGKSFTI